MAEGSATPADFEEITNNINQLACGDDEGLSATKKSAAVPGGKTKRALGSLAAELHIAIAEVCGNRALLKLRRVCRTLAEDTSDVFSKRFFGAVSHRLTVESMEKLCAITKVPRIARHVEILSLDISDRNLDPGRKRPTRKQRSKVAATRTRISSGLTEALQRLDALGAGSTLVVHSLETAIDFRCVGTALLQCNYAPRKLRIDLEDAVEAPWPHSQTLSSMSLAGLSRTWSKLEDLNLDVTFPFRVTSANPVMDFTRVLRDAPNMKRLSVTADSCPGVASFYKNLRASHLRCLEMDYEDLPTLDLLQILGHYQASLKKLSLARITLDHPDGWCTVLQKIRDDMQLEELSVDDVDFHFGLDFAGQIFGAKRVRYFSLDLQSSEMRDRLNELMVVASDADADSELWEG
ncbi:hypothetical protein CKM354_000920100 [Cercospora kikuchii]|uniref:F-box domain-containing protein n=1 Tax=Cercospora kikuchii TaxID=84275 RepID=A0A9P3CMR0_9PEZI|nr:uncharacterized protein CKM354_000920100 [Cercospora kikuchii]GIZ46062.1 hypothetical protein CKM354_000920100 [Cercospora kikuchii]